MHKKKAGELTVSIQINPWFGFVEIHLRMFENMKFFPLFAVGLLIVPNGFKFTPKVSFHRKKYGVKFFAYPLRHS